MNSKLRQVLRVLSFFVSFVSLIGCVVVILILIVLYNGASGELIHHNLYLMYPLVFLCGVVSDHVYKVVYMLVEKEVLKMLAAKNEKNPE